MVIVRGTITFGMSPSDIQKVWLRRKTTISAFGFLVCSFESSFFHSLNYACSSSFDRFGALQGTKLACLKIKDGGSIGIQYGRQKGNVII